MLQVRCEMQNAADDRKLGERFQADVRFGSRAWSDGGMIGRHESHQSAALLTIDLFAYAIPVFSLHLLEVGHVLEVQSG
jgi:hypothetical protein